LNGFATLSIEKDMLENIDVNMIINDFTSQNALKTTSYEFSSKNNFLIFYKIIIIY
jgi:hypothetical protein